MAEQYSQWRAMMAIMKASIRAIFRSPSAVVFSLAFPLVFILVFGFLGGKGSSIRVGVDHASNTGNPVYYGLLKNPAIKLVEDKPAADMEAELKKGNLAAIINIQAPANERIQVNVRTSTASGQTFGPFMNVLNETINRIDLDLHPRPSAAEVKTTTIEGRKYKTIDFILPGQLGFSLMSAAVFGTAFLFFSLRQTLVLKRFFATPIHRAYIILGEALSRLTFQLFGSVIIIGIGYFGFGFTLIHGFTTFLEMLLLSVIGLIVFMGFGFVVSGIAKNESTIPPFANIITLPQFLLAGTFFPIDNFPTWLQPICRIMPLTHLNDAMRQVAFEGLHIWNVGPQLLVLAIWAVVVYAVAVKVFRWE
ncbi:ABC-2 type transport system permease protein [Chitinophaga skermanii]|uniref:Transport permease protein n=1 Tax=Chitinophaga skermanii TaxID=331697 RepID=A0A327QU69_9BACT|nr:ABC transporter permease [Chitinophaga skermanii]RAJ05297.1 ABC-2 type transport system permease protein [Chitinophaga skermanii]